MIKEIRKSWVVDEESHAQPVTVTAGSARDGKIEILKGLSGNERLIAKPSNLKPNQPVKVAD